jgi:hypothetical protein
MDLSRSSMWLHQTMEEDDSTFLRYLIVEDRTNYELLLDDDNEEMAAMAKLSVLLSLILNYLCHVLYMK